MRTILRTLFVTGLFLSSAFVHAQEVALDDMSLDNDSVIVSDLGDLDMDAGEAFAPPYPRPRPRPGGYFQCTARDAGWEEHRFAHVGYGRNPQQAQWQAVAECQRFHGRCVASGCQRVGF